MAEPPPDQKKQKRELCSYGPDGTKEDAWIWEELLGKDDTPPRDEYFHDLSQPEKKR